MSSLTRNDFITFGAHANCTLALCPIEWTVYQYRPSLPVNIVFLALFAIAMVAHIYLGIRWKSRWFMTSVVMGCLIEIAGYAGRITLYQNPWSFVGFMVQIVLITTGPVFYTASIYVTLSMMIDLFGPELSRFPSKLFYWTFIPIDIVCLIFQAVGGALSASTAGSSKTGVYVALTGLGLQVLALLIFSMLFADYLFRYLRAHVKDGIGRRMCLFLSFLTISVVLILGRCAYRCHELSQGYQNSKVITNQGLFIGLEGVFIVIAVFSLCIGHPGFLVGAQLEKNLSSFGEESIHF